MKPAKKTVKRQEKKAFKAVTLLTRIEALLSDVWDECSAIEKSVEKNVRGLLRTAESSVAAAKDYFLAPTPAKAVRKPAKKAVAKARVTAKAKAPIKAKKRSPAGKKHSGTTVAVAKPAAEVIVPAPFVPPVPPATPPVITAN